MKNNMTNLTWNVYRENINTKEIEIYNIFKHEKFKEEVLRAFKDSWDEKDVDTSIELFKSKVTNICEYYYWGKTEWEVIISDWPPSENFKTKKVSVCDQLLLNWDSFIYYVLSYMLNKD